MKAKISEIITYDLPIMDLEYTKEFLKDLRNKSIELKKHNIWEDFTRHFIEQGLEVVFIHAWTNKELTKDGMHYPAEMVFKVYIGFAAHGHSLKQMGICSAKNVKDLCRQYELNPNFIFTRLDWKGTKEEIVKEFLDDLLKNDFVEDFV